MFKPGDKVYYHNKLYKIDYINKDKNTAKIHSIRGKTNEIVYNVDIKYLSKENGGIDKTYGST